MMKIALAQLNFLVGDVAGNAKKIIQAAHQAVAQSAKMVIFSELALTGYPPEDLLFNRELHEQVQQALQDIAAQCKDCYVVLGYPQKEYEQRFNSAVVLYGGEQVVNYQKQLLPNYKIFDEKRYFQPGKEKACVFDFFDIKTGLIICEDLWTELPYKTAVAQGAQWVIAINASPFSKRKFDIRKEMLKERIASQGAPIAYVNQVGGQDDLVFDGCSFVMDQEKNICAQAKFCQEDLIFFEIDNRDNELKFTPGDIAETITKEKKLYEILVLAVKDYVIKNGFKKVFIGLSGGIDSALTLAIAADALGADNVTAVLMPSRFTAQMSFEDAYAIAKSLKVETEEITIDKIVAEYITGLKPIFANKPEDVTEKNIQARVRGMLLMALANKFSGLVLTTSNKSEVAVGYSTLYGDMAGGFNVLKDVYKTEVYKLVKYRNSVGEIIPERVITRPPSAELAADQTDQDDLPPYDVLDGILKLIVEENRTEKEILQAGYDQGIFKKVLRLLQRSEYKRKQSPIGPRITRVAFGKGWRFPVTKKC